MVDTVKADSLHRNTQQLKNFMLLSKEERLANVTKVLEAMGFTVEELNAKYKHERRIRLPNGEMIGKINFSYQIMKIWFTREGSHPVVTRLLLERIIDHWNNKNLFVEYFPENYNEYDNLLSMRVTEHKYNAENEIFILRDLFEEYKARVFQQMKPSPFKDYNAIILPFFLAGDDPALACVAVTQELEANSVLVFAFRYDMTEYQSLKGYDQMPMEWLEEMIGIPKALDERLHNVLFTSPTR